MDVRGRSRDDHGDGILHSDALTVLDGCDRAFPLAIVFLLNIGDLHGTVCGLILPGVGDPAALVGDVLLQEEVGAVRGGEGAELDVGGGCAAQLGLISRPDLYTLLGLTIS